LNNQADIVIVGGGVIGCGIAYEVAKRGRSVIVLERERIAGQASGAAAGMLAAQAEPFADERLYRLALRSRALFPALAEELRERAGVDIGLNRSGLVRPALSQREAEELRSQGERQRREGEQAHWLDGDELAAKEPGLSRELVGGLYLPDDWQVSAPDLTQAFARSAAALGTDIREYAEVRRLIRAGDRIVGVETASGAIGCEKVIVAGGASGGRLLQETGIELKAYPVKGECFSVITDGKPLLQATLFSEGCYIVPKRGGRLLIGATATPFSWDRKVNAGGIRELLNRAVGLVPGIAEAEWERAWSGLRPQTPDELPYIGKHPSVQGLLAVTGHYRNGILLSAITAQLMADLAADNEPDADLLPFALDRHTSLRVGAIECEGADVRFEAAH